MKKNLLIVATGGTIAGAAASATQTVGYRAGALPVTALVDAVPGLADLAALATEQPFAIGSEDLCSSHWLTLAGRLRAALADPAIDAIVITHGTDTLEETAFFLDLVLTPAKPVVLTGAMRPATALGADGPANLAAATRFALAAAGNGAAAGRPRGVLVAFNDCAWSAATVRKVRTTRIDAFDGGDSAPVAALLSETVVWRDGAGDDSRDDGSNDSDSSNGSDGARDDRPGARSGRFAALPLTDPLPAVALIWQHVDCDQAIVDWHLGRGVAGLVLAGTGNGTMPATMRAALARASRAGCRVVRASRVAAGPVIRNAEADPADRDDALGFIAAGWLGPLKARLLLQCALAAGLAPAAIQRAFDDYR
ncbi:MAG: asparaginase [Lautropia sp.]